MSVRNNRRQFFGINAALTKSLNCEIGPGCKFTGATFETLSLGTYLAGVSHAVPEIHVKWEFLVFVFVIICNVIKQRSYIWLCAYSHGGFYTTCPVSTSTSTITNYNNNSSDSTTTSPQFNDQLLSFHCTSCRSRSQLLTNNEQCFNSLYWFRNWWWQIFGFSCRLVYVHFGNNMLVRLLPPRELSCKRKLVLYNATLLIFF